MIKKVKINTGIVVYVGYGLVDGQAERDKMLVIANNAYKVKLYLIQVLL